VAVADERARRVLLRRGFALEYATLGWNVVGIVVVGVAAWSARSVALAGFGLDSFIEIGASDPKIASKFLGRLFDWPFTPMGDAGGGWFQTPGMRAGMHQEANPRFYVFFDVPDLATAVADHVMDMTDLAALIAAQEAPVAKRGLYKKKAA